MLALAYVQMRDIRTVKMGDLVAALRITAKQERELLSRMARASLIASVRKGLYLFPERLPLGGVWTPDEATAINALMADKQARYQITGLNAFNRYGYDEQIPQRTILYNDALDGERCIGRVNLILIKVSRDRLGGTEEIKTPTGATLVYSSRVRTLVDAVCDWSRFDSLPRADDWIRRDIQRGRVTPGDLADMAIRYGNAGTIRHIADLFEQMAVGKRIVQRLRRELSPTMRWQDADPATRKRAVEEATRILRDCARTGDDITYGNLRERLKDLIDLRLSTHEDRKEYGDFLAAVSRPEHNRGRGMLSVVVVNQKTRQPGPGFFMMAEAFKKFRRGDDEAAFLKAEITLVRRSNGFTEKPVA